MLQVVVVCEGQEGGCEGQKQRAGRKTTDFLGHVPKSPDDSQISQLMFFLGVLCLRSGKWICM